MLSTDQKTVFLILSEGADRWAVMVSHPDCRGWQLQENARHWEGLYIPHTTVLLDISTAQHDVGFSVPAGSMILNAATLQLVFRAENRPFTHSVAVDSDHAREEPELSHAVAFPRWKVGVYDRQGKFISLFEREPS